MAVRRFLLFLVLGLAIFPPYAEAARTLYPEPFARATKVEIARLEAPLKLDGRLDEWKGVPSTLLAGPFQLAFGAKKWQGREDLAVELRLAWNNDNLLIAVKVYDSALANPHLGTSAVWQGDCVEIFVDGRDRKTRDADKYGKGVYQAFAAPALKQGGKADVHAGAMPKGMQAASSLFGGGYILEVAIPFANFPGVEAKAGQTLNLDVAIDDNDDGRERKQQLIWAGTVNNWATPAGFAAVTLVEKISDAGRVGFLASGLAVEFRLSPKLSGWVIPEVAVSKTAGDTVAGVDIALFDTNGKELYVVRNKSLKAKRGALVAGATLKTGDLDSGNYTLVVSYKDRGGKVMAKVKRPVQWREKGRGRISGKFWSRVKREEVKKTATIFTPQLLAIARDNIRKYPWAKAMHDKAVARAAPILKVPVETFLDLMPSPNMVRKYDKVCPHCGHTSMGTAPVVGILNAPWESRCIICGKSLPGFDAKKWFLSGKDERGWFDPGKADDSLLPKEAKFRETAILAMENYCSAYWPSFRHVVNNLRHAYAFTGDERYGRYALILLGRFAGFYPYFSADDVHDDTHPGALMQDTSECAFLQDMALAYDTCFSLVADSEVLDAVSKYRQRWSLPALADSVALQQHIEGKIFGIPPEERGDRMDVAGKMNKNVMVRIVNTNASRGHVAPQTIAQVFKGMPIGGAYDEEARKLAFGGFNEDGSNIEGSMEYDLGGFWYIVNHHREIMRLVPDAPGNIWKNKTVLAAYEHYFDLYCLGRYFPHFGDSWGRAAPAAMSRASYIGPNPNRYVREENKEVANHYAQVFAATGIERFAIIAQYLNGGTTDGLRMSIFDADPEGIQEKVRAVVEKKRIPLERSSVAPVFGVAMLKAGEGDNRRALWLRANRRVQLAEGGWHGHNDSMNIGLFGYGLNLLPDGEKFDLKRWIFGHNTVSRQATPLPHFGKRVPPHAPDDSLPKPILAEIDFLAEFPGMQAVRAVGINSKESRRTVFLTDVGADRFYVLDSLRVAPDIPEDYVTYCFRTMQGKITRGIGEKVSKDKFVGRSRTGGYWLEPLIEAPKDMGKGPWSIEVAIDDTYKVLEKPSDVKLRLTCLRPVDRIWHAWYKAVEGLPMKPKRVPYWFMTLGRPTAAGMPRRFTTLIEPYRDAKPVRVVQVMPGSGKDADIIEVEQANDRLVTFLSSGGKDEVALPRGAAAKAEVAAVIREKGAREIGLCLRGRYVRSGQGLALEAMGEEPASGGIVARGGGKYAFVLSTPMRVTLPGSLEVKVERGAKLKDMKVWGGKTSFTLVPDDALRGRGEFVLRKM